jgi:anti-sigma-K factor RskA
MTISPDDDFAAAEYAIEARIRAAAPEAPGNGAVVALERSIRRWRAAAIAASIVAGALAIGFVAREMTRQSAPREYVAILQKDAASPAFAVTVNLDKQELTVRPVAARAPPGKSYELWIIDAKLGARSLGVVGDTPRGASLSAYDPAVVADATYAVTVEPPGGSPDGKPSGPPVFVGKLIPVTP